MKYFYTIYYPKLFTEIKTKIFMDSSKHVCSFLDEVENDDTNASNSNQNIRNVTRGNVNEISLYKIAKATFIF
jgi:hypothetical protein